LVANADEHNYYPNIKFSLNFSKKFPKLKYILDVLYCAPELVSPFIYYKYFNF